MARNVTYSVAPRINPRDKEAAPKYYGRVQAVAKVWKRQVIMTMMDINLPYFIKSLYH